MASKTEPRVEKITPVIAMVYEDPRKTCYIALEYAFARGDGLLFVETHTLKSLLLTKGHYDADEINRILDLVPPDTDYIEFIW